MKQTQLLYFIALMCLQLVALAQEKGVMEFVETDHDFGEIKEVDGPATYEFVFENTGNQPIIISRVKASCGCTTPGWSKEPVLPGEKGFIKAQYNPRNRPGTFRKTLTVTSNADPSVLYLYIKGKVIPRIKTPEERMPYLVGGLRMKSRTINLSKITTEKPVEREFPVYNSGQDTIRFTGQFEGPDFIKISLEGDVLAPGQEGQMIVSYDPKASNSLGLNESNVSFFTDEAGDAKKNLIIKVSISEYFAPMSDEEKALAPRLQISSRMKDLGTIKKGEKKTETFELTNGGKKSLNIRNVETNCNCMSATLSKNDIAPGETVELTVTFDSTNRRGRQTKSVTIYSNDPLDPTQMVTVKTSVTTN